MKCNCKPKKDVECCDSLGDIGKPFKTLLVDHITNKVYTEDGVYLGDGEMKDGVLHVKRKEAK